MHTAFVASLLLTATILSGCSAAGSIENHPTPHQADRQATTQASSFTPAAPAPAAPQPEDQAEALWKLFQRWDKGTENERRDVAIELMDRDILVHGQSLVVLDKAFGGEFRVYDRDQKGGYVILFCRPQSERTYVGWWVGRWFVYIHFKANPDAGLASCKVDDYYVSNHDPMKDVSMHEQAK